MQVGPLQQAIVRARTSRRSSSTMCLAGILPTTGLPLPLFSYGGSSMISSLLLAGLLVRVAREENQAVVLTLKERRLRRGRYIQ